MEKSFITSVPALIAVSYTVPGRSDGGFESSIDGGSTSKERETKQKTEIKTEEENRSQNKKKLAPRTGNFPYEKNPQWNVML